MANNTKAIKKRIGSVKNTKKITRSVQMISAVKMQKTSTMTKKSKSYSEKLYSLIDKFYYGAKSYKFENELLDKRKKVKNILLVLITSNRGLCGSYNANVINAARKFYKEKLSESGSNIKVLAIGKKSAILAKKLELELVGLYDQINENPSFEQSLPISKIIREDFIAEKYDKVIFVYTSFVSSFSQNVKIETILPVRDAILENSENGSEEQLLKEEVTFEPAKKELFDILIPKIIDTKIYQAILESATSEHSSRMIAMKNANDNASSLVDALTVEYNKGRQASITQEMAEIIGGVEAISEN